MNSARMMLALARTFDWWQNRMMPESYINGGIADLLFVSRAGYVTEIEIKVSLSDWRADLKKDKWKKDRPDVARFYYCVTEELVDKMPTGIPEHVGILVCSQEDEHRDRVVEIRPAKRMKARKLTDAQQLAMIENAYHRFWRQKIAQLDHYRYAEITKGAA